MIDKWPKAWVLEMVSCAMRPKGQLLESYFWCGLEADVIGNTCLAPTFFAFLQLFRQIKPIGYR
jgi:hypothetical protein